MNGTKRGTPYGFSLWDFQVYGGDTNPLSSPVLAADTKHNTLGKSIEITFNEDKKWRTSIQKLELNGVPVKSSDYRVEEGKITLSAALFMEAKTYTLRFGGGYFPATVEQPIEAGSAINLALNKFTATSEAAIQDSRNAVDGKAGTRWESPYSDLQWISVDLGKTVSISRVLLNWENAFAKEYSVEVSKDGVNWETVYSTTNGKEGVENIVFNSTEARFVKVNCTKRNTKYGYSLWDLEVYS